MSTNLLDLLLVSTLVVGNLGLLATVVILSSLLRSAQRRIGRHERANRMQALQTQVMWPRYGDETVQFDVGQVRR